MKAAAWLARVQHDLVKRLLWPARDRRDLGGAPGPGELEPQLIDGDGQPTTAAALWADLTAEAPAPPTGAAALDRFGQALARAIAAGQAGDVDGVLALEPAFADLARSLDDSGR
jgi:hypothetical protein